MTSRFDDTYTSTKAIRRGKANIHADFTLLADFIQQKYSTRPINITYDIVEGGQPRLNIIFEFQAEEFKFRDILYNYDAGKQKAVKQLFIRSLIKQGIKRRTSIFSFLTKVPAGKYNTDDLLVTFSSFSLLAQEEANQSMTDSEIERLMNKAGKGDIWQIRRTGASATVFYYTDEQARLNSTLNRKRFLAESYFDVLKKYDEFGYYAKDDFYVFVSSKQTFEEKAFGNWQYYDR